MNESEHRSHWPISILSSLASIINTLLPLVIVRYISPTDYGIFKIFFTYLAIFPAFSLTTGIMNGLAYWAGLQDKRTEAMQSSSLMITVLGLLSITLFLIFEQSIGTNLNWSHQIVLIFSISLFGAIVGNFFEEASIATGHIWTGALFFSSFEVLRTTSIVITALLTLSIEKVFLIHAIMVSLKTITGYILGVRYGLVSFKINKKIILEVGKYALPVSFAWLFGVFVTFPDQLILSRYLSYEDFARYSVGCLTLQPLFILEQSITRILIPQLSQAFSKGEISKGAKLYKDAVGSLAFLFIPAVTGLVVFYHPIITILFSEKYSSSAQYLQIYALTYLMLIIPHDSVFRAKGNQVGS